MYNIIEKYLNKSSTGFVISIYNKGIEQTLELGYAELKPQKKELDENYLFDIASLTKVFTSICIYKAIEDKKLKLEDTIFDIDTNFIYLKDVSILDLITHSVELWTNGYLGTAQNKIEWYSILYNTKVRKYENNYIDAHYIILSTILETVYNDNYYNILNEIIFIPLNIKSATYEPKEKIVSNDYWFNDESVLRSYVGKHHDTKARVAYYLGIYTGHAGIFINAQDMMKVLKSFFEYNILNKDSVEYMLNFNKSQDKQYAMLKHIAKKHKLNCNGTHTELYERIKSLTDCKFLSYDYTYGGMRHKSKIKSLNEIPDSCSECSVFFSGFTTPSFLLDYENKIIILVMGNIHCTKLTRSNRHITLKQMFLDIYNSI